MCPQHPFPACLAGWCWLAGRTILQRPCTWGIDTVCGVGNTDRISCFCLRFQSVIHCCVLSHAVACPGRWITAGSSFFQGVTYTAEISVLRLLSSYYLILPSQSPAQNVLQGFQHSLLKTSQQLSWQGIPSWCLYLNLLFCVSEWTWSKGYCYWKREALFPQLPPTLSCFYCLWLSSGALINWCSLLMSDK